MSEDLRETDWNKIKNNDIDIYANNLTEHITNLANIHIPNKIIKIQKSDNEIRKSKTAEIENLPDKLKDSNISQSSWWKTLKYFIKPDQTSTIPPLNREGVIY